MRWLLKLQFDQNHNLINQTSNNDFKRHPIFLWILDEHLYNTYRITLLTSVYKYT
jgi:hypothetical protein